MIMAGRSNYRVKVDLSRYHKDARRFSWIYINSTNDWYISHLKRHIKDVFGIDEPFHLLLNGNEYLPPAEDVRVLNENEIIVVEPGSGISNANENESVMSMPLSDMENGFVKDVSKTNVTTPYQYKTKQETSNVPKIENETPNTSVPNVDKADATMYHSILDITENESGSDSKQKNDSIGMSLSAIEPYSVSPHKRKRTRRKKTPKQAETSLVEIINHHKKTKFDKPKIVDSYTLPSGKHIRFNNTENGNDSRIENENNGITIEKPKIITSPPSLPLFKGSKVDNLSSLLALRNCSSPIVFVNKKIKYESGNDTEKQTKNDDTIKSSNETKVTQSLQSLTCDSVDNIANIVEQKVKYSNVKPEEYPALESVTEIGDVIAFKVLRVGSEYTPEISGYIVAKTLDWCPEKKLCTFQILTGQAEIEGPTGKFSLPENEVENDKSDTVEFELSQLIEPRLINRE